MISAEQETEPAILAAADALIEAAATRRPIAPIRDLLGPAAGEAEAYRVQTLCAQHWAAAGRRLVGRKIGLTSPAVQRQLGVDQPDYGGLYADMARGNAEPIDIAEVLQPRVEAEIALVLERDLAMEQPTLADLVRATAFVAPAIEIVGSRISNWDIRFVDTVADNASSGLYVLGSPCRSLLGADVVGCRMEMFRHSEIVATGSGADCLGSPLNAAVWLARRMAVLGTPLRAGDTIMTGALGPMVGAVAGDVFSAVIDAIGSVETRFINKSASTR